MYLVIVDGGRGAEVCDGDSPGDEFNHGRLQHSQGICHHLRPDHAIFRFFLPITKKEAVFKETMESITVSRVKDLSKKVEICF